MLEFIVVLVVLAAVVWVVTAPLRAGPAAEVSERAEVADLEAAKEVKYREIREAELDFRTGKLSHDDWRSLDRELRGEAVALLRKLDAAGASEPGAQGGGADGSGGAGAEDR